ncbi:uncharacterized protein LOC133323887 [Musca vetustissima]|uniref:uncharacterized protein LOC133323887 n=1 Tax=Musca vetustissima TaxID=27455 RepID=UPI002AB77F86|nr:uncharacterized protein LOC133323887 [Musca vetustissima]
MNDYWHIPRASLSPSSASSAVSSASSTQRSHRSKLTPTHYRQTERNSEMSSYHQQQQHPQHAVSVVGTHIIGNKRGSRSSQGSNDSNNSTRSAASGSLLLTAANLERMTEIQRKQEKQSRHNTRSPNSVYSANLLHAAARQRDQQPIDIDPNLNFIKTKDLDTVSIASSMHFTMVNGEAGANKKTKKGLCDRGRQVTVLIISMSTIFLLLIMGMVYALEMRAREMPQS